MYMSDLSLLPSELKKRYTAPQVYRRFRNYMLENASKEQIPSLEEMDIKRLKAFVALEYKFEQRMKDLGLAESSVAYSEFYNDFADELYETFKK